MKNLINILAAASLLMTTTVATAQVPPTNAQAEHGVVGHEVFSTSTPGGGGQLKSQGVNGKKSSWYISSTAPARLAVTNVVITYYHCKECRDKAKAERKKLIDLKKKEKADNKKKKDEPMKKAPPKGKDTPTYDPRFWKYENGKLIPVNDHSKCPKPDKFECGQHYLWWLENHKHAEPKNSDDNDHSKCKKPLKFECGAHYQWWLRNHKHISSSKNAMLPNEYQLFVSGTVVPGQPVTGTVLDANGAVASGVVIEITDGEEITTDEYGRFWFIAPEDVDTILLTIAGTEIRRAIWNTGTTQHTNGSGVVDGLDAETADRNTEFDEAGDTASQTDPTPSQGERIMTPQFGQIGQTMEIAGYFPLGTNLTLDGDTVAVLASSPSAVTVVLPANLVPGRHTVELQRDGEIMAIASFAAIILQIELAERTLMIGQKGRVKVKVIGTEMSVAIQIDVATPGILKALCNGRVYSSGGSLNFVDIEVVALKPGAFKINLTPLMDYIPNNH
ncbi:MAG: carboxypeptidase regulatory-like domain-containing protein [Armatimonadetes bacterium]|nr:carboxypeptidase regulatory-like domain-containing protein [Armatimonadota bacterium]